MPTLDVYSRRGCHLCEVLLEELQPLVRSVFAIAVHDIDTRDEWRAAYGDRIPVVVFAGEPVCEGHLDRAAVAHLVHRLQGGQQ
jgi:hypothetical protein